MIPRIINYCWFGKNPLPSSVKKCIKSWKYFCPNYEIREWNEDNFDINQNSFIKRAYKQKNWAFVSDYARLKILYDNGGIYLDTDVELLQSLDCLVCKGPFLGFECGFRHTVDVNPGQGFACEPKMEFLKQLLDSYGDKSKFDISESIVNRATSILINKGLALEDRYQKIMGFNIYPTEYLGPMNFYTGQIHITRRTIGFHHYDASWTSELDKLILRIERCNNDKNSYQFRIRRTVTLPLRIINKLKKLCKHNKYQL